MSSRPALLSGYAAKSCARVTHNIFDVTVPEQPVEVSDSLQALFDRGNSHEADIFTAWLATRVDIVDLRPVGTDDKKAHIAATLGALAAGRHVILGGRLPDDIAGGRTGKPDALVRCETGGYHPGDVKAHLVVRVGGEPELIATLTAPGQEVAVRGDGLRWDERDLLQLTHYWRMLEASGHAAAEAWGAIIGTEGVLGWYDLTEAVYTTFSRSEGKKKRSALERYDHEHDFRVRVADIAQQRTGANTDPEPLVQPFGQSECLECAWAPVCVDTLPEDDLSARLPPGKLSVREYLTLQQQGISTLDDLTGADLEILLQSAYAQDNANRHRLARRLQKARTSAELTSMDLEVRLRPGATFDIPRADVEIDLDVEWDRANRVYLWGALVTTGGASTFVSFLDLTATNDTTERALARPDASTGSSPSTPAPSSSTTPPLSGRRCSESSATSWRRTPAPPQTPSAGSTCTHTSAMASTRATASASKPSLPLGPALPGVTTTQAACSPRNG